MFKRVRSWWRRNATNISAMFLVSVLAVTDHWTASAIVFATRIIEAALYGAALRLAQSGGEIVVVKPETSALVEMVVQRVVDEQQRRSKTGKTDK